MVHVDLPERGSTVVDLHDGVDVTFGRSRGGLRNGMDVYRALALGARGVLIGRPWVWALAGGGSAGLGSMLAIWRRELANTMALTGVTRIADIAASQLDGA